MIVSYIVPKDFYFVIIQLIFHFSGNYSGIILNIIYSENFCFELLVMRIIK